ncbi:hypothetical protein [Rufibacter latericius]|uniref:DUF4157 domain-containing protein n=1 Tax=Rufibacter latericius TaxID=2487040 RepID=A0A3M9MKI6_9BACT|nr:hypothetical protein [Rufibacter latericius]RNI25991.1 hypothetical protein EFB08_14255 [Rufibacter latericius]
MQLPENNLKIIEQSPFARIARWVLKTSNVAMVLGKTIHLSGVSKEIFLQDTPWVAHELCHVRQFQEHGYLRFLWLYFVESLRVGYYNNKYEVEARLAGTKQTHLVRNQSKNPPTTSV